MTDPKQQSSPPTWLPIAHNLLVGLSVSVVTLSLSAALGVLSGRGAFAGMLSACIIVTVTSLIGGTRVQCSGPTGPMSALAAAILAGATAWAADHPGEISSSLFFNLIMLEAAMLLVLAGIFRVGALIKKVPNVVISGFMNGIALIIWLSQTNRLIALEQDGTTSNGWNVVVAAATFLLTFAIAPVLRRIHPRLAVYLPGMLLAIIIATIASHLLGLPVTSVDMGEGLHNLSSLLDRFTRNWIGGVSAGVLIAALPFALQITALCYIDSLLTVRILDRITGRTSRPNQELAAQGFANGILALIGGVPGAMATERSVMAVREGATMRIAGIAVGVFALIQLLLLQDLIGFIPEAVFSGVLFRLGYDVFDFLPMRLYFKELAKGRLHIVENWLDRHDDEPIFVTHIEMALIVATMVITGVFNLIAAVVIATLVFYFVQKTIAHGEPLRDLKPFTETRPTYEEIH